MRKLNLPRFLAWYFRRVKYYLMNGDTVLVEASFGSQAFFTSLMSIYFGESVPEQTRLFLWLNALFALPQIALAFSDNYYHRHWSNWITFVLSSCVSVSLVGSGTDQIAIYGYGFLGLATLHAAFLVNARMHQNKNNVNHNNQGDELGSNKPL